MPEPSLVPKEYPKHIPTFFKSLSPTLPTLFIVFDSNVDNAINTLVLPLNPRT